MSAIGQNPSQAAPRCAAEIFWVSPHYGDAMRRAGLTDVEAVMQTLSGRRLRAVADRENWRIELHAAHGGSRGAYLKKHREPSLWSWITRFLGLDVPSPGAVEAQRVRQLAEVGVPAMQLVAYGERGGPRVARQSFVIVEELAGYTQLDHYLRRRFPIVSSSSRDRDDDLESLVASVADVARRFHAAGFNHRDLYCCHFFVLETAPGRFDVRLIDLQRVEQRRWFRRRWLVKDLAQLAYSLPLERVKATTRMRFIKHYLGVARLRMCDKRLIRTVLAKRQQMIYRLGPHP